MSYTLNLIERLHIIGELCVHGVFHEQTQVYLYLACDDQQLRIIKSFSRPKMKMQDLLILFTENESWIRLLIIWSNNKRFSIKFYKFLFSVIISRLRKYYLEVWKKWLTIKSYIMIFNIFINIIDMPYKHF